LRGLLLTAAALAFAQGCGAADAALQPAEGEEAFDTHTLYLNFSRGSEGVAFGAADDAARNVSALCGTRRFAAWSGARDCDGDECPAIIRELVADHFAGFGVRFTLERPRSGRYGMVIVAPFDENCSFGRLGVALTDCDNANPADVAFVFGCATSAVECAALVAHEAAHTLGLVHVASATDLMTLAPADPSLEFQDITLPALENECGITEQSSQQALLAALGASPPP
jgi:hypothetical protein